jgi:DNA-binding response OmpR family regulator
MQNSNREDQKKRLLIVEDDQTHRKLLVDELSDKYILDIAPDSERALRYLSKSQTPRYDMIILDLRIPRVLGEYPSAEEGFRILKDIHIREGNAPVVLVVSGNMIDRTRKKAMELGVQRVFAKPFSIQELRENIDKLLQTIKHYEPDFVMNT